MSIRSEIEKLLTDYFEEKTKDVLWYDNYESKEEVTSLIDECLEFVDDTVVSTDRGIDKVIESLEDQNEGYFEELARDNAFRERELIDYR